MIKKLHAHAPFLKFAIVGTLGFAVDSLVLLFALHVLQLDPYTARLISFMVAVTFTWLGNRFFTFADRQQKSLFKEWLAFVLANAMGGFINYAIYSLLVAFVPFVSAMPVWGVAAGSITAMLFNYVASSRFVFRKP